MSKKLRIALESIREVDKIFSNSSSTKASDFLFSFSHSITNVFFPKKLWYIEMYLTFVKFLNYFVCAVKDLCFFIILFGKNGLCTFPLSLSELKCNFETFDLIEKNNIYPLPSRVLLALFSFFSSTLQSSSTITVSLSLSE